MFDCPHTRIVKFIVFLTNKFKIFESHAPLCKPQYKLETRVRSNTLPI